MLCVRIVWFVIVLSLSVVMLVLISGCMVFRVVVVMSFGLIMVCS